MADASNKRRLRGLFPSSRLYQILLLLSTTIRYSDALSANTLPCSSTAECQQRFGYNSTDCIAGQCSNPFYRGGCLDNAKQGWNKLRACNSEDAPDAAEKGFCRLPNPHLNYTEVRIHSQNWESPYFMTWILQILLSEVLNVPTTVETGTSDANVNFYNPGNSFGYGNSNDWESMRVGQAYRDCRLVPQDTDEYVACSHAVLEVWYAHTGRELVEEEIIEPHMANGALGQQSWFIPRFTGERDATLLSHLGLAGEENRKKLAETFLRPTTWGDYCDLVSTDGCASGDEIARRPPIDDDERQRMFVEGIYTGHFRATEKNNCELNPTNCTGHIADYPCGWSSYVQAQAHHLGIALSSDGEEPGSHGYKFAQLVEIWAAANATKSNVIMQWWTPDRLERKYKNSEAEFIRLTLPAPSQECAENRVSITDRCSAVLEERVGNELGACAEEPRQLLKMVSTELKRRHDETSMETQSPAYETILNFQITDLQIGRIFDIWTDLGRSPSYFDPRDATCQWVVDNFDSLMQFVPESHPRVLAEVKRASPLIYVSMVLGIIATILTISAIAMTFRYRVHPVMVHAQIDFLYLILFGVVLVSIGSLAAIAPPTNASCISVAWLIMLGYTLELVPLIVKIAAINHLMTAARKMRRVNLKRRSLFGAVALLSTLVVLFLTVWMIVDPPHKMSTYAVTSAMDENGDTIVDISSYCSSDSPSWSYIGVGWNALYLVIATVLAFQTRKVRQDLNESSTLGMMVYSHFVFVIFRVIVQLLDGPVDDFYMTLFLSLTLSCDAIATLCIYFLPKFLRVSGQIEMEDGFSCGPDSMSDFSTRRRSSMADMRSMSFTTSVRCMHCARLPNDHSLRVIDETLMTNFSTNSQERIECEESKESHESKIDVQPESAVASKANQYEIDEISV